MTKTAPFLFFFSLPHSHSFSFSLESNWQLKEIFSLGSIHFQGSLMQQTFRRAQIENQTPSFLLFYILQFLTFYTLFNQITLHTPFHNNIRPFFERLLKPLEKISCTCEAISKSSSRETFVPLRVIWTIYKLKESRKLKTKRKEKTFGFSFSIQTLLGGLLYQFSKRKESLNS